MARLLTRNQVSGFGRSAGALLSLAAILSSQVRVGPDEMSLQAASYAPSPAMGVIRGEADLVEVPVVVRDNKGAVIPDLKREDFELFDERTKREITAFSVENFPPVGSVTGSGAPTASLPSVDSSKPKPESPKRFIALVLDDLNTDFASLRRGKDAAKAFVSHSLEPFDQVGVFTTESSQNVQFTADPAKLQQSIEAVTPHPHYSDDLHECPVIRAYEAYLIVHRLDNGLKQAKAAELVACTHMTLDAAIQAVEMKARAIWENASANTANTLRSLRSLVDVLAKMPGQHMVLLASGGFLSGDNEQLLQELATAALHRGVVINALDLRGLYTVIPGGDASTPRLGRATRPAELAIQTTAEDAKDDGVAMLASATGGQSFRNNNDLLAGFRRLGAMPEVLYVLGFAAGSVPHDGKYHALNVRLAGGRHGSLQFRKGYIAPSKEPSADLAREQSRDRVLMGSDTPADVAVRVTAEINPSVTGPKVDMRAWIDVSRLNFETRHSRHDQNLTVIAALLDPAGNFVTGRQADAALTLKESSFQALSSAGLTFALSLHAPPGSYKLRVLVQEALTGKITATSQPIEIR
jgi:VWFA-related protein